MCLEWWWSVLYVSSPTKRTFAPILNGSLIIVSFSRSPVDQYSRRMSWVFSWLKIKGSRSRRMRFCADTSPTHLRDTHVYTYMKSLYKIRTHHAETHRNTRKIKYLTHLYNVKDYSSSRDENCTKSLSGLRYPTITLVSFLSMELLEKLLPSLSKKKKKKKKFISAT